MNENPTGFLQYVEKDKKIQHKEMEKDKDLRRARLNERKETILKGMDFSGRLVYFANFLRDSRKLSKKTVRQIVNIIGLKDTNSLERYEDGSSFPSSERLSKIAEAYGVDLDSVEIAFSISKEAREQELGAQKVSKAKKYNRFEAESGTNRGGRRY